MWNSQILPMLVASYHFSRSQIRGVWCLLRAQEYAYGVLSETTKEEALYDFAEILGGVIGGLIDMLVQIAVAAFLGGVLGGAIGAVLGALAEVLNSLLRRVAALGQNERTSMNASRVNQQLGEAMRMAAELQEANPGDGTLAVVAKQLAHLRETFDHERAFDSIPRERMTFGVIAAKNEYDVNYPKFADLLHEISYALKHSS